MPDTDTAVSESGHQTPHPQSSGCRIRAPSAALCSDTADNWKDAHDPDLRFAPCTAGLNHCAGVASASDLQGNFPKTGLVEGSDPGREPSTRSSPAPLSCACSAY